MPDVGRLPAVASRAGIVVGSTAPGAMVQNTSRVRVHNSLSNLSHEDGGFVSSDAQSSLNTDFISTKIFVDEEVDNRSCEGYLEPCIFRHDEELHVCWFQLLRSFASPSDIVLADVNF